MRKLISSINMTLDGFCNHEAMIADDELHENVNELFRNAGTLIFGRVTYQLMENAWPPIVKNPTGNKPMDDFATLIDRMEKVVFSHTLKDVTWNNSRLAPGDIRSEILNLKKQPGKNIVVGGPSLISQLMNLDLIDEYQFCIHPVVLGKGLTLFKNIQERNDFKLLDVKPYASGVISVAYERIESGIAQ